MRNLRPFHARRRGGAIVELALVAFALCVLVFGMADYGRALLTRHAITSLSREAANLESRGTTFDDTLAATFESSGDLDLATHGFVILTAITRDENGVVRIAQQMSRGGRPTPSRIGVFGGGVVTIPNGIPLAGQTLYVAEISVDFTTVTPISNLIGVRLPDSLYDVAFFRSIVVPMPIHRLVRDARNSRAGSVLLLSAIAFLVLLLMVALVIDGGLIYGKRAEVAKAVDAAAIAGINNMSLGQGQASQLARDMFLANYRMTPQDASAPDVDIQFHTDVNGGTTVDINATAHLRPLFIRVFPEFRLFDVHASSQAVRAKLVMSLVLDRSGSMSGNGGCIALPPAVDTFVGFFNEATDRASLVTFASNARVDVPMSRPFIAPIRAAVPRDCATDYGGYTFFDGGLELAGRENANVVIGPGETIVKVVVFFTDGLANTFQDTFDCPPATTYNLTSGDADAFATLLDPVTGEFRCDAQSGSFSCCPNLTTFPSILGGTRYATGAQAAVDVRAEAKDRARLRAKQIRNAGSIIYTIGLGDVADQAFLKEIANDPSSPAYDPSQPSGEFALAPTAADLQVVFQVIARKILVRISI